jgi:hypothetical protein
VPFVYSSFAAETAAERAEFCLSDKPKILFFLLKLSSAYLIFIIIKTILAKKHTNFN